MNKNYKIDSNILEGPIVHIDESYGGLGKRYLAKLLENIDKIHQIDTVTGITESNGSVRSRSIVLAQELRRRGIKPNDIIVICSRSHADQTIVVLSSLLVGAILAPLDPDLSHKEFQYLLTNLKPKICFCDLRALKQIDQILQETDIESFLVHFGDEQQGVPSFQKWLLKSSQCSANEKFQPQHIDNPRKSTAFIIQTQGTTGIPKLVCLSHHFIHSQILIFLDIWNYPERVLSFFPLSWIMQTIFVCLCFESPIIRVLTGTFAERTTCKIIHDLKVDCAFLGTHFAMKLVDHVAIKDFNLSCLKTVIVGSLITSLYDIKHLTRLLPSVKFIQIYYTTETGCILACKPNNYKESLERFETVGRILQNYKVQVVDTITQKPLGPGKYGELLVKGDIMLGYYKDLNSIKNVMTEQYYKTGDLAKYDNSGWFYIQGRIADLISKGDFVFPSIEIEDVILMHPYVKDVVVIGNQKELLACVIIKPDTTLDSTKLISFISDKLSEKKRPTRYLFLDSFPRTSIGKVKKNALRNQYLKINIERSDSLSIFD